MKLCHVTLLLGALAIGTAYVDAQVTNITLIPPAAVWKYLDNGSDLGTTWRANSFDDSAWAFGPAQLGYGDSDEATLVSYGGDANFKYVTTYFRRAFTVTDASSITGLTVRLLRDDGGIVYLNGIEVFRSNMPFGFVNYSTLAAGAIPNQDESVFFPTNFDAGLLLNGTNVIAVEIHQANRTSTDMSFDLSLTGVALLGAPVIHRQPQNQFGAVDGDAGFSVSAAGSPPLHYQWQFEGADILGATGSTLRVTGLTTSDDGRLRVTITNEFGSVVSDAAKLTLVNLTGDFFQITSLSTDNAQAIEHAGLTGDDRGGIAASLNEIYVTGDSSTARFSLNDLSGGTWLGRIHDSIVSDLKSGAVYVLANGTTPVTAGSINALLRVDIATGALTSETIPLSANVNMNGCYGCVGVFSGFGRIVLHNASRAYAILLPSGEVLDLGPMTAPQHQFSENWAFWGVAEFFNDAHWLVYVRDSQTIVRTRVPDGLTFTVGAFANLSDMASFTVSPLLNRWYFHHQYGSQFRSGTETVGFADAKIAHEQQPQPPFILMPPRDRSVPVSSNATFTVSALGYPLNFQWQFNGQNIIGATNQTLTLTGVSGAEVGLYTVVVANNLGTVSSSPALLNVVTGSNVVSRVAVFGADPTEYIEDVRQKIQGTALFDHVDGFDVRPGSPVPTLAQLQQYDAVLFYSDYTFNDSTALGNVLADYVEDGGGVVLATFAFSSSGSDIQGRFLADGYLPFTSGFGQSGGPLSLVADNPSHPILDGVTSFIGGSSSYRNSGIALTVGAELVAHWNGGDPLVSIKPLGNAIVVGLNFFPPSSDVGNGFWDAGTDGAQLMANALIFAGRGGGSTVPGVSPAIRTQPANATVLQGLDAHFMVTGYGSPTLAYQWLFNSAPIANGTNRFLTVPNVQTNQNGGYSVIITNAYGSATSQVATLTVVPTRGAAGFFTDFNTSSTGLVSSITTAQFTPVRITDINTFDLSRLSVLLLNETSDHPSPELRRRLPDIQDWVSGGGRLVIHQRYYNSESLTANPFLVGTRGIFFTNFCCSADVNVSPGPSNLVVAGPHGTLNNTSFDNGEQNYQAIAGAVTLPPRTTSIFTAGTTTNQAVAFAYGMGAGLVYHSSLWLDWYLDYSSSQVGTLMRNVYAPNLIEFAAAFTASGPPGILAPPENLTVTTGSEARFIVSAQGQPPLQYQWLFNGSILSGATNYSLQLSNVSGSNAGSYSVIVSNGLGSASSAATLKVVPRLNVAMFYDPQYIYIGFNNPAASLQAMLNQLGHHVRPFTNLVAALTNDVVLFPQFGPRALAPDLDSASRSLLQAYVSQGGLLIVQGGYANVALLNSVFDLPVGVNGCYSNLELNRTARANGTPFAESPFTIAGNYCMNLLYPGSLPSEALSIYTNAFYGSAVTLFPYGAGTLIHLGWSWDDAAPSGQQDGGWSTVLASAVQSRGAVTGFPPAQMPLVAAGSVWRYLDNGSDQNTAWIGTNFNDSAWPAGPAQLGYGDGDEATVVGFGLDASNRFITTYFRRNFTVANANAISNLTLRLLRDDGVAVYLNGVEIVRDCLNYGAAFNIYAYCTISGSDESQWYMYAIDPGLLQTGTNLLAVEIHQANATSSDISFDLELTTMLPATVPFIRTQPVSRTVASGANIILNVVAAGELPLNYQWRFGDQNIPGATNAILFLNGMTTNQSGRYSVVVSNTLGTAVSSDALVSVAVLGGDIFRIASLSTNNAFVVDHRLVSGDDRGGISASAGHLFYSGDNGTTRFSLADLSGATNLNVLYDSMVSDLRTERVYLLSGSTDPSDLIDGNGGVLTTLLEIDGTTGNLIGSNIRLSQSIDLIGRYSRVGFFAGLGRIVIHDGARAWNIELPSGLVTELGSVSIPTHSFTENWAYWGVAEFFDDAVWMVYVRDYQTIVRTRVSDGFTETVATFDNLSDMASITVSIPLNRWYFHHQVESQFSQFYETTGFADAAFVSSAPPIAPTIVKPPENQTIAVRSTVAFRVAVRGTGPLRYQWLFENEPLVGATNSTLTLTQVTTNHSGAYSVIVSNALGSAVSSAGTLTVVPLGGETFKITSLFTNAIVVDDYSVAGYDRGAIAVSGQRAFYSGNNGTAQFDLADFSGGTNAGVLIEGLISDLGTETVYALGDGTNLINSIIGGTVTTLLPIDGVTGNQTGASVALTQPIYLGNRYGNVGFFAGLGQIVVTDGAQAWTIDTVSGRVLSLGPMTVPLHHSTEIGAYWGVAEFFNSSIWLVYVRDSQTIVRTRVPDGLTETVAGFQYLSDMAAITVSVPFNRWYFHHQYNSQFSSFYGTLGFADATFISSVPPTAPSIVKPPLDQSVGVGGVVKFTTVARGTAPLSYQWLFEGAAIPGATNTTLTLTNISIGQAGHYSVIVSNSVSGATSAAALLRVVPSVTVAMFSDPAFVFTNEFGQADNLRESLRQLGHLPTRFASIVQASTGSAPLLFPALEAGELASTITPSARTALQSFVGRGGTLIIHGTANDPSRPTRFLNVVFDFNLLSANVSLPSYRTAAAGGTAFADDLVMIPANYTTLGLYTGLLPPGTRSVYEAAGGITTVALIPYGSGQIIYLGWNWNNAVPLGQLDGGWLTVLESAIEETIPPAGRAPEIIVQPQDRTVVAGTTVRLRVAADGSPFTYQWLFNNQPMPGSTNYLLQLNNVTTTRTGIYSVIVSNAFGSITSSNVVLTVVPPVTVGVFDDPRFVNTSGGIYSASDNLQASLIQLGHRVQPFTNIIAALTNQVLVFPVVDQGDLVSSLDSPTRAALQLFVQNGGLIICHGYYNNVSFLNSIFGLSLSYYGYSGGQFIRKQSEGTPLANGPVVLPYNNDTFSLYSSTLPSFGARNLYSGFNADYLSAVALIQYGSGNLIYVGWNWQNALPSGSQDGGWVEMLGNAVLTRVAPSTASPVITLQPQSQDVVAGLDVTFSIGGYGSQQLQWFYNSQPVVGATNVALTLPSVNTNQSGDYFVVLSNPAGSTTSQVARLNVRPTRGSVGYYTDYNTSSTGPRAPILQAGFTPVHVFDIATYDLSLLDILMIDEANNGALSPDLLKRLPAIESWVNGGGRLVVHDRIVSPVPGQSNRLLLGTEGTVLINDAGEDVEILSPGNNLVVAGPHGALDNSSLDNGGTSYHGYAHRSTLPARALPILGAGLNANHVVAFSYGLGAGSVYYAAMPLDYFLEACCNQVWTTFRTIYTPNVIEHAAAFAVTGPPALLAEPRDAGALVGGNVTLRVSANGSVPFYHQWLFNGAPILDATNSVLVLSNLAANQAGGYSVVISNSFGSVTSDAAELTVIQAAPFRIVSLSANGSVVVEHNNITGDDRGGIAISATHVFYSGDNASGRFSATNLSGGIALPQIYNGMVSDLRAETLYHLANGTNLVASEGALVTTLIEINGSTGALTSHRVQLSTSIPLGSETGIFAGYGAVVLHTGGRVYRIELPSGLVLDLGALASFSHYSCENWAYWGVAEFFGGSVQLVYVRDSQTIARTRVSDGATTNLANYSNLSDMCSFTVSSPRSRWYFHYEGTAQFGGNSETVGYASATFDRPPRFLTPLTNVVINEDAIAGPISFSIADTETTARLLTLSAESSNPILLPVTNIVLGGVTQVRTITLTPAPDQFGTSVVTLTVIDSIGLSTNRSFTITVNPVNDAPIAQSDSYVTDEDLTLAVGPPGVLNNDTDADPGTTLTALLAGLPAYGTVALNANGSFLYTPAAGYSGPDSFAYLATDGTATSAVATVNIIITPVNDPPVALDDSYVTDEDATLVIVAPGLLMNDSDIEGDPLTAHIVTQPAHGTVSLNANGSFTYTPAANYNGSDFFAYRANDGSTNSAHAIVTITVNSVNDAPVLADLGVKEAGEGSLLTFIAAATDAEAPTQQTLTYTAENIPLGASINAATGEFRWTPAPDQVGTTNVVTIRVTDNGIPALSDSKIVTIIVYPMPFVAVTDVSVPGGSSGTLVAEFEVTLSAPITRPVWVDFATADGTATAGADYAATNGVLFFPPGTTNQTIEVTVTGNPDLHFARDFFVNLANVTNAILNDAQAHGLILDEPASGVVVEDVTVVEGTRIRTNAAFVVNLSVASDRIVTLRYAVSNGTATVGKDFGRKKGKITFQPDVTSQTVLIPIVSDALNEENETFAIHFSAPVNAVLKTSQAYGLIVDDDPQPSISIADVTTVEPQAGARAISFLTRLSAKNGRPVSVNFATSDGTAVAGADYTATNGTLVFPAGTILQRVHVNVLGNAMSENSETFFLNLADPVNATLGNAQATGHVNDNDRFPLANVSDGVVDLNALKAMFTIRLSVPSDRVITLSYITAPRTAVPGIDYTTVTSTVDFAPGEMSKIVTVDLLNNTAARAGRSFLFGLVGASNAVIGDRVGACTIPGP